MLANPRADLGIMLSPGQGNARNALPFWRFALDNGCFSQGDAFDAGDWLEWLATVRRWRATCVFAVAPDVMGDAYATRERSAPYLPTIRQLGFPAAYVAQDGQESFDLDWESFDVLFIGGSTDWKLSEGPHWLARQAKAHGKWTHVGRVNSLLRLKTMRASLFDSADGNHMVLRGDRGLLEICGWLDAVNSQSALLEVTA
jgi:hypothetical protein